MKTNRTLKLITLTAAIFGFAATSFAQNSTTDSDVASTFATIVTPISIEKSFDLKFGNIIAGTSSGTVTVTTDGTRSQTGGATFPQGTGVAGDISAAEFTVTGLANAIYSIAFTATDLSNGSQTMTINDFTENANKILAGGSETFKVGATLNVADAQSEGIYEGTLTVTVNYN